MVLEKNWDMENHQKTKKLLGTMEEEIYIDLEVKIGKENAGS